MWMIWKLLLIQWRQTDCRQCKFIRSSHESSIFLSPLDTKSHQFAVNLRIDISCGCPTQHHAFPHVGTNPKCPPMTNMRLCSDGAFIFIKKTKNTTTTKHMYIHANRIRVYFNKNGQSSIKKIHKLTTNHFVKSLLKIDDFVLSIIHK